MTLTSGQPLFCAVFFCYNGMWWILPGRTFAHQEAFSQPLPSEEAGAGVGS